MPTCPRAAGVATVTATENDTFELQHGDIFELKGIVRRSIPIKNFPKISG